MKIPAGLTQFVFSVVLKNIGNIAETPLEKVPHIDVIGKAYLEGETLEVIVGLYIQATGTVKDDEIIGKVAEVMEFLDKKVPEILASISKRPFKEVVEELLGDITIPDFDDNADNNIKVVEIINDIMNEIK